MTRRRWPELRAGLIAAAIAIGLVDGCPLPPPSEVLPWQRTVVDLVRPVRDTALIPFAWVSRRLRFSQRWALFQAASRDRFRLELAGRDSHGAWLTVYRAGDPAHQAYADVIEPERIRGAWQPTDRPMLGYDAFARWLTARLLADRPELTAARIRFEKVVLDDGVHGTGAYVWTFGRGRGASAAADRGADR